MLCIFTPLNSNVMCHDMLQTALLGKERLWVAFWVYFIGAGIVLNVVFPILLLVVVLELSVVLVIMLWLGFVVLWFYWVWFAATAIWRSSNNASHSYFGYAAKAGFVSMFVASATYGLWIQAFT